MVVFVEKSLDCEVGEKVKNWRLERGHTQKDLARKIGVKYWVILQYEKGNRRISIERLYAIAEALSVSIVDLIPVSSEKICLENEEEEILNLVRKYKKINDKELRKMFCLFTKFVQVSEKSSRKDYRLRYYVPKAAPVQDVINFGKNLLGKRSAGKLHAAFDEAGAGNVNMGILD